MKNNNEITVDELWTRAKPGIRQLVPKMDRIGLLRLESLVKRALRSAVVKIPASDLSFADRYLTAAEADKRAAVLLFEAGEIALTVYHIQQAIEKATKGLCVSLGYIKIEELYTTHRTPQPLLRTIKEIPGGELSNVLGSLDNRDYRSAVTEVSRLINSDPRRLVKLPMYPKAHEPNIEIFIKIADALTVVNSLLEAKENEVKTVLGNYLSEYKQSIYAYSLTRYGQAAAQCYILGVLTFAHESHTRYPDKDGFLEPSDYKSGLGIVDAIPDLIERIPRTLEFVKDAISVSKEQNRLKH